jgi:hypothetical protein
MKEESSDMGTVRRNASPQVSVLDLTTCAARIIATTPQAER